MQKVGIRRAGAAAVWRERIARQARSGLSAQEYCRREGVSAKGFYRWRFRLRAEGAVKSAAKPAAIARREPIAQERQFIDLGALPVGGESASWEIRLELGGGVVLQLARR